MPSEKSNSEKLRGFIIWFFYVVIVGGGIVYHFILFPVKN